MEGTQGTNGSGKGLQLVQDVTTSWPLVYGIERDHEAHRACLDIQTLLRFLYGSSFVDLD